MACLPPEMHVAVVGMQLIGDQSAIAASGKHAMH
jgi:hypothetical protein